ncbi:MAG: hypothetical protein R2851_24495 [Caldilineaceae bacterium]
MNWKRNPHPVRTLLALGLAGLLSVLGSRMAHAASQPVQSHSPPAAGDTATGDAAARVLATLVAVAARPTAATPAYRADAPGTQIFLPLVQDFVFTSHRDAYQTYEGAVTCLRCHEEQARQVHGSVHYQWFGPTPDVPDLDGGGKLGGINDFCGFPDINFIGQMVNLDGETVDGGCATCHVGMGARPQAEATDAELANIDCLVCHSPTYRRKVEAVDGGFRFVPAPERMAVPEIDAITDVQKPTDENCLACHVNAGGGDNNKRGDIESTHADPPSAHFDVHMAPPELGGAGLGCLDCHVVEDHHIAGRGTDLRATDLDVEVKCTNCHPSMPHDDSRLNEHTARVDCATCHIPSFAKVVSTEMDRDYREAEVVEAKRLYEPKMTRQSDVTPAYVFDNGTSDFYEFGTPITLGPNGRVVMATPLGSIQDDGAKIIPVKHHTATQPVDLSTNRLIPVKLGLLFQTGDPDAAIVAGATAMDWPLDAGYDFVGTERYMGIYHEVAPASEALACDTCHGVDAARLDFAALGYTPKDERNGRPLCLSCHGYEDDQEEWGDRFFYEVHNEHVGGGGDDDLAAAGVNDGHIACSECHTFSAATTQ